jgi:hypothetical protein
MLCPQEQKLGMEHHITAVTVKLDISRVAGKNAVQIDHVF